MNEKNGIVARKDMGLDHLELTDQQKGKITFRVPSNNYPVALHIDYSPDYGWAYLTREQVEALTAWLREHTPEPPPAVYVVKRGDLFWTGAPRRWTETESDAKHLTGDDVAHFTLRDGERLVLVED